MGGQIGSEVICRVARVVLRLEGVKRRGRKEVVKQRAVGVQPAPGPLDRSLNDSRTLVKQGKGKMTVPMVIIGPRFVFLSRS